MSTTRTGKISATIFQIGLTLLLSIGGIATCMKSARFKDYYFTSDTLYTFEFFNSVRDGMLSTFQFSHLPNFFPEAAIILPLMAAKFPLELVYAIYSIAIFLILTLFVRQILRALAPHDGGRTFFIFVLVAIAIFVFHPGRLLHVILAGIHGASFAVSVACTLLAWRLLSGRTQQPAIELASLSALTAATTLSDVLFVFQFIIPCVAASAVVTAFGYVRMRRAAIINSAIVTAGAGGALLLKLLPISPFPPSSATDLFENFLRFVSSVQLSIGLGSIVPFIAICAVFAALVYRSTWAKPLIVFLGSPSTDSSKEPAWLFFWIFGLGASLTGVTLTAVAYLDFGAYRYAISFFWWPIILGVSLLEKPSASFSNALPRTATICVAGLLVVGSFVPSAKFWAGDLAQCLATQSKVTPLNDGLAGYWIARPLTLFAEDKRVVSQVTEPGDPYLWINNRLDYLSDRDGTKLRNYNFVILNELDRPNVVAKFGMPSKLISCGRYEIAHYGDARSLQHATQEWFAEHP